MCDRCWLSILIWTVSMALRSKHIPSNFKSIKLMSRKEKFIIIRHTKMLYDATPTTRVVKHLRFWFFFLAIYFTRCYASIWIHIDDVDIASCIQFFFFFEFLLGRHLAIKIGIVNACIFIEVNCYGIPFKCYGMYGGMHAAHHAQNINLLFCCLRKQICCAFAVGIRFSVKRIQFSLHMYNV